MFFDLVFTLIANLLPLAGVAWWGWDAFEVLILYWMQTLLVTFFTVLHVGKVPPSSLGTVKVDGRSRPATRRDFRLVLGGMGLIFCAAHILFLWVFFSGDWSKVVRGPFTFWQHFVIANGAWAALLLNLAGGVIHYLATPSGGGDTINGLYVRLFLRIFAMQAAIIFGAMLLQSYGAKSAPLIILIVLKTLFDLGLSFPARAKALTSPHK